MENIVYDANSEELMNNFIKINSFLDSIDSKDPSIILYQIIDEYAKYEAFYKERISQKLNDFEDQTQMVFVEDLICLKHGINDFLNKGDFTFPFDCDHELLNNRREKLKELFISKIYITKL